MASGVSVHAIEQLHQLNAIIDVPQPETASNAASEVHSTQRQKHNTPQEQTTKLSAYRTSCASNSHEPLFRALTSSLLLEGVVPSGSILDAGAHQGTETACFAALAPARIVHAIDPLGGNLARIDRRRLPNVRTLLGALGSESKVVHYGQKRGGRPVDQIFEIEHLPLATERQNASGGWRQIPVYRVDDLFAGAWSGEQLGLAHWDVEGSELEVLRGDIACHKRGSDGQMRRLRV